jgi:hypothetical protein
LERKAVHDSAEHAHVVSASAIHATLLQLCAAEIISTTDNNCDFNARTRNICDLFCNSLNDIGINTDSRSATKDLTREL